MVHILTCKYKNKDGKICGTEFRAKSKNSKYCSKCKELAENDNVRRRYERYKEKREAKQKQNGSKQEKPQYERIEVKENGITKIRWVKR